MRTTFAFLLAGMLALACLAPVQAQDSQRNLDSLGIDGGQPVKIDADRFEVFDARKQAVFTGNVVLRQGEVSLQTHRLVVTYSGGTENQQGRINRLEADGGVVVRSKEQTATGDRAVYEVESRVIRVSGNVVLSQGGNVIRGNALVVDLATATSRLVSSEQGGQRVQGLFLPGDMQNRGQNPN